MQLSGAYLIMASRAKTCVAPYKLALYNGDNIVESVQSYVGAAATEYQAEHCPHGKPLRNGLDEYAARESHEFGEGRSLVVYAV